MDQEPIVEKEASVGEAEPTVDTAVINKDFSKEVLDKEGSVTKAELAADDKAIAAEVILNEEESVAEAEWAVDDHGEDFCAEFLREAKLLGLEKSAFLASVFDEPNATAEGDLLFTTSVGEPPFTNAETEEVG